MRQFWTKLWRGIKASIKWILIQEAFIFGTELLIVFAIWLWARLTGADARDIYVNVKGGGFQVAQPDMALVALIPVYTTLFGLWHAFFPARKQWWTYIVPWGIFMVMVYLEIAWERDWNFKIITIDWWMLFGWLSPLFGVLLQSPFLLIRYIKRRKNKS